MSNETVPIRVFLVDDHELVRAGVRSYVGDEVEIIGEASEVNEAIQMILELRPDVVLQDIHMPDGGGLRVIESVLSRLSDVRFLALTVSHDPSDVVAVIRAGASGYLTKDVIGEALVDKIRTVHEGGVVISPQLAAFALDVFDSDDPGVVDPARDVLDDAERQVAVLIAKGYTLREVANELAVSPEMVETLAAATLHKLRVTNRSQVARWVPEDRRPSGEPTPLPKQPLAGSGKGWIAGAIIFLGLVTLLLSPTDFFLGSGAWWNDADTAMTDWFVDLRTGVVTDVAKAFDVLRTEWLLTILRWGTVAALVVFKRWRHLAVFFGAILGTELITVWLSNGLARPRPDGVEILTDWSGFAAPSLAAAALTVTAVAMAYALIVPGGLRSRMLAGISGLLLLVGLSRVYLAVDRITDVVSATVIGVAIPLLAFRLFTPDEVFPVSYGSGKTAHLDIEGPRRTAIVDALRNQLGVEAVDIEKFGLEGSGGSTPLRITVADGSLIFGKIYAKNHLRSDRWYKLGRAILYGALEDEAPYRTVRQLAEHEDHVMRLMTEAGVPSPAPLGIIEIARGREYLVVTEFLDGVAELSEAEVDVATIDAGMWTIKEMWDRGLAHRDIKPANLLVDSGNVYLIDHAFGEIGASAWRQAIDLANMMLAFSVHLPPDVVYARARRHFSSEQIAEAFAATRGVTIPGELRAALKGLDFDAITAFRDLGPPLKPIRIQRWTRRRLISVAMLVAVAVAGIWLVALNRAIVGQLL